ncbi:hypothetical protein [Methylobacterium platani]|nr:hypothetical protein [Methylobacterium platani]
MARDKGHSVEIRARIAPIVEGATRLPGDVARTVAPVRSLAARRPSA